jgi:hypothetical protein
MCKRNALTVINDLRNMQIMDDKRPFVFTIDKVVQLMELDVDSNFI